jgi:hypothetical protein
VESLVVITAFKKIKITSAFAYWWSFLFVLCFSADLANLVNEAALLAGRASKLVVDKEDFSRAVERSVAVRDSAMKMIANLVILSRNLFQGYQIMSVTYEIENDRSKYLPCRWLLAILKNILDVGERAIASVKLLKSHSKSWAGGWIGLQGIEKRDLRYVEVRREWLLAMKLVMQLLELLLLIFFRARLEWRSVITHHPSSLDHSFAPQDCRR